MELDPMAEGYIKPKEPCMGTTTQGNPYIGFTYPKTPKQIEEETKEAMKLAQEKKIKNPSTLIKNIKHHINCYIRLDKKNQLKIITETEKEYKKNNFRYELSITDNTIHHETIRKIILNKYEKTDIKEIYNKIIKQIKKYCYLKEEAEYQIIAIYILLTYKYLYFDFMPIIHLNGEGGTGKSQIGKIMKKLGFNSTATVSTTASSFFRRIDRKRGLYFMDEKENLQEHEKELLNGCTYEGNIHTVSEKEGDNYKDVNFNIYTPVVLACISDIYGATSTRTIKIETIRPPRNAKKYPVITNTEDNETWQDIRSELCIWSLYTYEENIELMQVDEDIEKLISNRGVDTWKIILNQAKKLDIYNSIKEYIIWTYMDQVEDSHENDVNYKFLRFLLDQGTDRWVNSSDLYQEFSNRLTQKQQEYFNITRYGRLMRRLGFNKKNQNKKRTGTGWEYCLDFEMVLKYIRNNYEFVEQQLKPLEVIER